MLEQRRVKQVDKVIYIDRLKTDLQRDADKAKCGFFDIMLFFAFMYFLFVVCPGFF